MKGPRHVSSLAMQVRQANIGIFFALILQQNYRWKVAEGPESSVHRFFDRQKKTININQTLI